MFLILIIILEPLRVVLTSNCFAIEILWSRPLFDFIRTIRGLLSPIKKAAREFQKPPPSLLNCGSFSLFCFYSRVWDWERSVRMVHFNNQQQPKVARITSLEFINGHDDALLLIGTDDGSCRVWRDFIRTGSRSSTPLEENQGANLVSAWNCIAEMAPSTRCSGLVLDWNQESLQLLATGDVRLVRIWDVERELKVVDIPTGSENCVTSVHHNPKGIKPSLFLVLS